MIWPLQSLPTFKNEHGCVDVDIRFSRFSQKHCWDALCDGSNLEFLAVEVKKLAVQGHEVADCGFSLIFGHLNMLVFTAFILDLPIWRREASLIQKDGTI